MILPAAVTRTLAAMLMVAAAASLEADQKDTDWPTYGNDPGSSKYAPLDQINRDNVADVTVAWQWESPDNHHDSSHTPGQYKSTPIKIGNRLFVSTSLGLVAAIDAITGRQLWVFDTGTWEDGRPTNLGFNHRGVAYWQGNGKRRILMPTNNAWLWSLDADTGQPDPAFGNAGKIDLTIGLGREVSRRLYSVVSAPMVVDDVVIVGSVVSDIPVGRAVPRHLADLPPGHIRGFDVQTGKQRWIFHSIPQAGEPGVETWEQSSWQHSGGTNVWTLMSADPELGYVYLPFGTPSNDWYGGHRLGDNLYAESLVCLDARTGERIWHFQTVHHGLWDYDLPAAPNLVDITVDGKSIKAVAQITKQGFVFVLDRVTGEPVWPIEERPVPASNVPGERASPTQPFPTRPAPFDLQGLRKDDLIDFTPELRRQALAIVEEFDYGPLYTPPSEKGTIQLPGDGGGGEWSGAAFDPETSMFFIPSMTRPIVVEIVKPWPFTTDYKHVRGGTMSIRGPGRLPLTKPPWGRISALDLSSGDYSWVVPNGEGLRGRLIEMGIDDPGPVGNIDITFVLATRSLLFTTIREQNQRGLRALDKQTGELVGTIDLPVWPGGAPMTYMADGRQYIVMTTGSRRQAGMIALALDPKRHGVVPTAQPLGNTAAGMDTTRIYQALCAGCHDNGIEGAPRPGQPEDWSRRLEAGMEEVYQNTLEGIGDMPPRGVCMDCSDDQLRAVVDFMIEQ